MTDVHPLGPPVAALAASLVALALAVAVAGCGGRDSRPLQAKERSAATAAVRARLKPPAGYSWQRRCLGAVAGCYRKRAAADDVSRVGVAAVISRFGVDDVTIDRCRPARDVISCGAFGSVGRYGVAITFISAATANRELGGTRVTFDAVRVRL